MNVYFFEIPWNNHRVINNDNGNFNGNFVVIDCFNNTGLDVGTSGFIISSQYSTWDDRTELLEDEPVTFWKSLTTSSYSIDLDLDTIDIDPRPFPNGTLISMKSSSLLPSPIVQWDEYFTSNELGTSFSLYPYNDSLNPINFTDSGSGELSFYRKWCVPIQDLVYPGKYSIIDGDGNNLGLMANGLRCDSKSNYRSDVKQYINNVEVASLDFWKSAGILFADVNKVIDGVQIRAYLSFIYHGNFGLLI